MIYVLIGIVILGFVIEQILDYLNTTKWSNQLPDSLIGIYDQEKYLKSQNYEKSKHNFGLISDYFSFIITLSMLLFGGFAIVNNIATDYSNNIIIISLIFFGIIMFGSDILGIPFSIYGTFVIEEKFGFNKTTVKTFILDKIKGWILTAIIGGGILALIVWFYLLTKEMFWIYTWVFISVFSIFMSLFYSNIIVPLFNKQTPLEEGELKDKIQAFCAKVNYKLKNIYVIDGSKRSTKANAYFTGFGAKKRIVLFDTLINDLSDDEIVAVLAHEIGHYKHKHTIMGLIISILQTGLMLFLLSLFISQPELSSALGVDIPSFHIGLIAFGILYSPISMIIGLFMNVISRKNEYQADNFAKKYHNAEDLIESLKKLSVKSLSNLTPHPAYVFFHYSHPTLLQRIENLKK